MTLRIFKCQECGHKMRVTGDCCGFCLMSKPDWQAPVQMVRVTTMTAVALLAPVLLFV